MIFERASLDFCIFILMIFIFYGAILSTFLYNKWITLTMSERLRQGGRFKRGVGEGGASSSGVKVG